MRWRRREPVPCPQCDAPAPPDARWCGTCGAPLREARPVDDAPDADPDTTGRGGRIAAAVTVVALLGGMLVVQATGRDTDVPAGFTSRGDAARSGIVAASAVPAPSGVAWRAPVDIPALSSPGTDVVGVTDTPEGRELVVVLDPAETGRRVTAHDARTGDVVATTMLPLGAQPYGTAVGEGLLVHHDLRTVTAVELATGARRWTVELRLQGRAVVTTAGIVVQPADAPGTTVLLDHEDGSEVWRHELAGGDVDGVVATSASVVVDEGERLVGLDPSSGGRVWELGPGELPLRTGFPSQPVATDGDQLLVLGNDAAALVAGDGSTVARLPLPSGLLPVAGTIGDGLALVTDVDRELVAIDVATAELRWRVPVPVAPVLGTAVRGGVVAVRGDAGTTLLDATDGEQVATIDTPGAPARLAMTGDGAAARVLPDDASVEAVGPAGVAWRAPTIGVHLPDLATDAGAVAVTTPDGVQVHDVTDGTRRFAHEAFEASLVEATGLTAPALVGSRVAIAPPQGQPPDRGGLLALFADTGIVDWARAEDRVVPRGTPIATEDLLLLPVGSQVLGFDRRTGRRALVVETSIARTDVAADGDWLVAVDAPRDRGDLWVGRRSSRDLVFRAPIRTCAPPVLHGDVVIVTDDRGDIVARELETGDQPWGERARGSACRPMAIAGDVLVALVDDRELVGIGLDDGDTDWRVSLPAPAAGAPVVAGRQVLVPTLEGEVVAYDTAVLDGDGPARAWRVDVDGVPAGAVAVDGDTVLVLTRAGELVALR